MANTNSSKPTFLNFRKVRRIRCRPSQVNLEDWSLTDRQERIPWWSQQRVNRASVLVVGAGGLGSNEGLILTQMGVGRLDFVDGDMVEDSNRNRQFFTAEDVGKPKAHQVLKNLEPFAVHATLLRGYFTTFDGFVAGPGLQRYDVVCCGVDDESCMVSVARYGIQTGTPIVFANVSKDGEATRVFIQRPGEACFACYKPRTASAEPVRNGCTPLPAIADILRVAVGLAARAAVGEILDEAIGDYNCRDITFSGHDIMKTVPRRNDCLLCGRVRERASQLGASSSVSTQLACVVERETEALR